jgi:glycosyltransferase involved in cell wall biosynthesis
MALIPRREPTSTPGKPARPYAFLVSTTGCARGIRTTLGSAAYSYYFVLEALIPVLERLGTWRLLDRPESSLPFAAARAEAAGYQPIHLALNPPQDCYLTPALPNVIFPFWEFPDVPNRDFGFDTKQNWVRICSRADLLLTACEFTASAFRQAGVPTPIGVVPVPLKPEHFSIPAWDPQFTWNLTCRHVVWGGPEGSRDPVEGRPIAGATVAGPAPVDAPAAPASLKRKAFLLARKAFRKVYPWLGTKTLERIAKTRHYILAASGRSPWTLEPLPGIQPSFGRFGYTLARDAYRRYIQRWLSKEALEKVTAAKVRTLKLLGKQPVLAPDPLLPATELSIGGLVYASIFNLGDKRKNHVDLLTAFLLAFRDREDATLVIKLATNPVREHHEIGVLRKMYEGLGIDHKCRIVVITDFLTDDQMADLMRVTTFYVNTSRAEGACLPLQQSLAAGRPSIAPDHTAMADFMDDEVGFVLRTHPEPTYWPHDPEQKTETYWNRLVWTDLRDCLLESAQIADHEPETYRTLAEAAQTRMRRYASSEVVARSLQNALEKIAPVETGRFAWAS